MTQCRCIIVAGFPHSGTSWLAKGLSFAPGFTYYREPDNYEFVPGAEERLANLYLTVEHDDHAYRRHLTRAAAGEVATARTVRQDPGSLLGFVSGPGRALGERSPVLFFRKRHVLLKLVYANLNLAWLSANLPHARQVCVLRHPCGQFDSWKRLGWEPKPERLQENARLVSDHLAFAELIRSAGGYWERAGALWAASTFVIHRQTLADSGRILVSYEWLCGDPVGRFEALYGRLGLTWSRRAERFLLASDREDDRGTYLLTRPTAKQVDKWKERLSLVVLRGVTEVSGLPWPGRHTGGCQAGGSPGESSAAWRGSARA